MGDPTVLISTNIQILGITHFAFRTIEIDRDVLTAFIMHKVYEAEGSKWFLKESAEEEGTARMHGV